jgi:signal transduction histidine kinase
LKLAERVLAGSLAIVALMAVLVVIVANRRLHERLISKTIQDLRQEAGLIASQWGPAVNADSLADAVGQRLQRRVTLIDSTGRVIGDTDFDPPALNELQNHNTRPEVVDARRVGFGWSRRISPSAGDEELYVAVQAPALGVARLSMSTAVFEEIVDGARRDVLIAATLAMIVALALTVLFARRVSRPIVELRNVARELAGGQLERRPQLAAPGEVGDLAEALSSMSEQLATRLDAVKESEALTSAILQSLAEGIVAFDGGGNIVRLNDSARNLLKLRQDVALPFPIAQLPRDRALRDVIAAALRGETVALLEAPIVGRTLALNARPLMTGGAVVTLFDLTTLRRLETVRSDFVANVSHELRTPLTAIHGFAETLADDIPEADRRRFAATISANAQRMERLVDDLLDLGRIESGGWVPDPVLLEARSSILEAVLPLQHKAKEKALSIETIIAPNATQIYADATAFRQVVGNLVDNAIRYTSTGGITVSTERDTGGVLLRVHDTGVGIPAAHLDRIFERFYRVDPSRSRADGGTGLGLSIVKHLVEAHGGSVRAESEVGRGTTLSVLFPDYENGM